MTEPLVPLDPLAGELRVERVGRVLTLTINNPTARNAMSVQIYTAGSTAIRAAAHDKSIGVIVINGAGGTFSAGGNANRMIAARQGTRDAPNASIAALHEWVLAIRESPQPVIAAVDGVAAGAGCALALNCDLLVAANDAKFFMAYVKIGVTGDGGATAALMSLVPRQFAAEMMLTGAMVGAERLHQLGVVNRLTAKGGATSEAVQWAATIAAGPPQAMAAIKRLLNAAPNNTLAQQLDLERGVMIDAYFKPESGEGLSAFLEKRPADFLKR
jgi:enoyl-CoA hydratase/carnithine racemase